LADRRYVAAALLLAVTVGSGSALAAGLDPADSVTAALEVYDPLLDEADEDEGLERDPFERANRWTFAFNEGLDRWLLTPITRGYQWLVPGPMRRGVNRVFDNLNAPVIFANEVLQLRPVRATTTLTRFVVNSTFGVVGVFDVADEVMDLPRGEADFGQTLARYWIPRGPYLVVPVFGPSTARDAVGTVVDVALDPLTYIVGPLNLQWQLVRGGSQGLALRDSRSDQLDALRGSSVDFYSALRSAYLQSRHAMELEVRSQATPVEEAAFVEEALPAEESAPVQDPGPEEEPGETPAPADQDSVPDASFSMRSSIAAISASKSSRLTMPENSDLRSASSLTVPSR
jgi:phospholipid-binding lipoprotein MlaA